MAALSRHSETSAMKWQSNGELAGSDLHLLLSRLHKAETDDRASELARWLERHSQTL